MSGELVSYKKQINAAHHACVEAKELGGKKAHECGTWLAKQRENVPEGQWEKWIRDNCEFEKRMAYYYLTVAGMEVQRVAHASVRECLKEAVDKKEESRILKEYDKKTEELRKERVASHRGKSAAEKAAELQRDSELKEIEDRKAATRKKFQATVISQREIAVKVIEAGYRMVAKELHPDHGGAQESMVNLNFVKDRLMMLVKKQWRA